MTGLHHFLQFLGPSEKYYSSQSFLNTLYLYFDSDNLTGLLVESSLELTFPVFPFGYIPSSVWVNSQNGKTSCTKNYHTLVSTACVSTKSIWIFFLASWSATSTYEWKGQYCVTSTGKCWAGSCPKDFLVSWFGTSREESDWLGLVPPAWWLRPKNAFPMFSSVPGNLTWLTGYFDKLARFSCLKDEQFLNWKVGKCSKTLSVTFHYLHALNHYGNQKVEQELI